MPKKFKGFEQLMFSPLENEILKSFDHHGELLQVEYALRHLDPSKAEINEALENLEKKQLIVRDNPLKLTRKANRHKLKNQL